MSVPPVRVPPPSAPPLGAPPPLAGRVVLGAAAFSLRDPPDAAAGIAAIRAGVDAGARVVDTARAYATPDDPLHGERLVRDAIAGHDGIHVITKGGHWRRRDGSWAIESTPARLRRDAESSLEALGVPRLDAYLLHRADDPALRVDDTTRGAPFEAAVRELARLRAEGIAARVGLSNVGPAALRRALALAPIDVVENRAEPGTAAWAQLVALCEAHGIHLLAYAPFGGPERAAALAERMPRLAALARARGRSVHRLAIRGLLASSAAVSVVVGATRAATAVDAALAERDEWSEEHASAWSLDGERSFPELGPLDP